MVVPVGTASSRDSRRRKIPLSQKKINIIGSTEKHGVEGLENRPAHRAFFVWGRWRSHNFSLAVARPAIYYG
jgi:hypothetical protein